MGPQYKLRTNYCEMVVEAGGIPVIVPTVADLKELGKVLHGLLIPGGRDIDSKHFGQPLHPKAELQDPERFRAEKVLYESIDADTPVFGICYGSQFMNVVHGGTLHQHLPDIVVEDYHSGGTEQKYEVSADSKFGAIVAEGQVGGKSYHHQAVDQVGDGLRVVARHEDGTVEAIEGTGTRWMIGVQWHPERSPEAAESKRLFRAFVDAARVKMESQ